MRYEKVREIFEKIAPLELAESWDNSGEQIYTGKEDIETIMFCLELNDQVIMEAIEKNVDLIVIHHPLMFNRPDNINAKTVQGRYIINLIKKDISVYAAHTNFDKAPLGNNYYLSKLIGLSNIKEVEGDIGVTGILSEPMKYKDILLLIKERLNLPDYYIKSVGDLDMIVEKVAVCTGAGGDLLYSATKEGCQMVLTGDVKLNIAQDAKAMGMALVDAGHYGTEKIFAENFMDQFEKIVDESNENKVKLILAQSNQDPYNSEDLI